MIALYIALGALALILLCGMLASIRLSSQISHMEELHDLMYKTQESLIVKTPGGREVDICNSLCASCKYREGGACIQHFTALFKETDFQIEKIRSCNYWEENEEE